MSGRMRGDFPKLSVIVAVRDVEDTVGRDVRCLVRNLRVRNLRFEILAVNDGSCDTSLPLLRFLSAEIPELEVLGNAKTGRAFRRGAVHAQGEVVLLWEPDRGMAFPGAVLGWALSRLERKAAVIVRGRFILADRMKSLPVLLQTNGRRDEYETRFERGASGLGLALEIAGQRPRRAPGHFFAPVLRILSV